MSTDIVFIATSVNCYVEDEVTVIGISDSDISPDNFIILTRFDEDEESVDNRIGLITHLSDIEAIHAIKQITIGRDIFILVLNNDIQITAHLNVDETDFIQLKTYLFALLKDSHILLIEI